MTTTTCECCEKTFLIFEQPKKYNATTKNDGLWKATTTKKLKNRAWDFWRKNSVTSKENEILLCCILSLEN